MNKRTVGIAVAIIVAVAIGSWFAMSPKDGTRVVAIATLMSHPALDAVQENLKLELARQQFVEGKDIRIVTKNANGQVNLAKRLATKYQRQLPDEILAALGITRKKR